MLSTLASRPALTLTTAIVAVGVVVLVPALRDGPPEIAGFGQSEVDAPAPGDDRLSDDRLSEIDLTARVDGNLSVVQKRDDEGAYRERVEEKARIEAEAPAEPKPVTSPEPMQESVASADEAAGTDSRADPDAVTVTGLERQGNRSNTVADALLGGAVAPDSAEQSAEVRLQNVPVAPAPSRPGTAGAANETFAKGVIAPVPPADIVEPEEPNTEAYANADPNDVKVVADEPVSTFSIDVDTASYSVVRQSLMNGHLPPADAVRIEEMINYFPYDYAAPGDGEAPFRPTVSIAETPWNPDTQLMHIALQGRMPAVEDRPPLNLVFLVDSSGSMDQPNKLPLLKQSFRLMLGQLSEQDSVAIVTYAGRAGLVLEPTPAIDRQKILAALNRLSAGGSTAGQAGLQQAYAVAEEMAADASADGEGDAVTRVILATDGDFNVGLSDPGALKDFIAEKRQSGTYLSVLGFGRGNLDDATMQALAQNGNGQAAYIDTLSEAQKVLVDQLTGALFPIANDVKIQVEFNPATVAEYRLIGYETRALKREDFNNDKVDAGEIGAGHSVTALYEITPVGSPAVLNNPLRYAADAADEVTVAPDPTGELAFLRLRYKEPGESRSKLIEVPITPDVGAAGTEARFAAAIAGFGQLLKEGEYVGDWGWAEAVRLAEANTGDDPFGYRREAVTLMRLAQSLAE